MQINKIEDQINKKKKEQKKILEWFTEGIIEDNIAKEKLENINKVLIYLNQQKEQLDKTIDIKNNPNEIYNIFTKEKKITLEEKRNLIRKIVDKVYVERLDNNKNANMEVSIYIVFK